MDLRGCGTTAQNDQSLHFLAAAVLSTVPDFCLGQTLLRREERGGAIRIFDFRNMKLLTALIPEREFPVASFDFSSSSRLMFVGYSDDGGTIVTFDTLTSELVQQVLDMHFSFCWSSTNHGL